MLDIRLSAIEEQLKALSALMQQVVRVDERLAAQIETQNRISLRQDDHDARLRALETADAKQSNSIGSMNRLFWLALGAAATWIVGHLG